MKTGSYAKLFSGLDVSPTSEAVATFCTKGTANPTTAVTTVAGAAKTCGNGFAITLDTTGTDLDTSKVTAYRVNNSQYTYTLSRPYQSTAVTCTTGTSTEDAAICAEYCGIDSLSGTSCTTGGSSTGTDADGD